MSTQRALLNLVKAYRDSHDTIAIRSMIKLVEENVIANPDSKELCDEATDMVLDLERLYKKIELVERLRR